MVRVKRLAAAGALLGVVLVQGCGDGGNQGTAPAGHSAAGSVGGAGGATAGAGGTWAGMRGATAGSGGAMAGTGGTASSAGGAMAGIGGANAGASGTAGDNGGSGGSSFMAVAPCNSETDYVSDPTTITWEGAHLYTPACLKVKVGTSVTFSGLFSTHPLEPSAMRGTLTGNPIKKTREDGDRTFTFSTPGFFAYWCTYHGSDTTGANMTGVIWVE